MNFGYASTQQDGLIELNLEPEDQKDQIYLQLYHYVAVQLSGIKDFSDKDILEVGSGRGGGLYYIQKYLKPKNCTGVDFSTLQVDFCNQLYESIKFLEGDAEHLLTMFNYNSKDLIISVETSHCYGQLSSFANNVYQILKPRGIFVWADFVIADKYESVLDTFRNQGLQLLQRESITQNVLKAMNITEQSKQKTIRKKVHRILRPLAKNFVGTIGSDMYKAFQKGNLIYVVAKFTKSEDVRLAK